MGSCLFLDEINAGECFYRQGSVSFSFAIIFFFFFFFLSIHAMSVCFLFVMQAGAGGLRLAETDLIESLCQFNFSIS